MSDDVFLCTGCGRVGTEDDGCELGGDCPDEDCDGTTLAYEPNPTDIVARDEPVERIYDDDSGTTYTPFIDAENGIAGYTATRQGWDGPKVCHIYICPSGGSDDGVPCAFVYIGESREPWNDPAMHHYNLDDWIGAG